MYVAAALLVALIGSVYSDDGCGFDLFSFIILFVLVDGEGVVELALF